MPFAATVNGPLISIGLVNRDDPPAVTVTRPPALTRSANWALPPAEIVIVPAGLEAVIGALEVMLWGAVMPTLPV
jgi:hypothetical protein